MAKQPETLLPQPEGESTERRLDHACARVFATPEGALILEWLRASWVNTILGPESTDIALRHREGGRFVVASIMMRIEKGKLPDGSPTRTRRTGYNAPDAATGRT